MESQYIVTKHKISFGCVEGFEFRIDKVDSKILGSTLLDRNQLAFVDIKDVVASRLGDDPKTILSDASENFYVLNLVFLNTQVDVSPVISNFIRTNSN